MHKELDSLAHGDIAKLIATHGDIAKLCTLCLACSIMFFGVQGETMSLDMNDKAS